jgi:hypothetical protein
MHDEAVAWLTDKPRRAQLRSELQRAGYRYDGVQRQGEQEVDGFSRASLTNGVSGPATGLTLLYAPDGETLVGLTVLHFDPVRQQDAKNLSEASFADVDAPSTASASARLHFLGVERLGPRELLEMMIRVDTLQNDVYSVMYVLSAE